MENNNSNQDLERRKLELEIEILKENLEKQRKANKQKKNIGEIVRKNTALILAIVSVFGGFVGIILPLNKYFEEQKKAMLPTLNDEIIMLVDKLNDSASDYKHEEATVLLNYYGLDAIPVLLLRLKRSNNEEETKRLIQTIKNIQEDNRPQVVNEIVKAFRIEFSQKTEIAEIDEIYYYPSIYNFIRLLKDLDLSRKDKGVLREFTLFVQKQLPLLACEKFQEYLLIDLNKLCEHHSLPKIHI